MSIRHVVRTLAIDPEYAVKACAIEVNELSRPLGGRLGLVVRGTNCVVVGLAVSLRMRQRELCDPLG